jgi:hypothetical protein
MMPPPAAPVKINIQISGKDMAASSGVFGGEKIGKQQPPGRTTIIAPDKKEKAESTEETPKKGSGVLAGIGSLLGGAAKKATESKFKKIATTEIQPSEQSVNWFSILFLLTSIVILFTSRY